MFTTDYDDILAHEAALEAHYTLDSYLDDMLDFRDEWE